MDFPISYFDEMLVVKIGATEGSLFSVDVEKFIEEIRRLNKNALSSIAFDLSEKSYFNSADLGFLVKVKDFLFDEGIDMILIRPSEKTKTLLNVVQLTDFFKIAENEEELKDIIRKNL